MPRRSIVQFAADGERKATGRWRLRTAALVLLGLITALIVGVSVSIAADPIGQVTLVPSTINPGCDLYDMATDLDGNVWLTDWSCQYEAHRISPSGAISNYHLSLVASSGYYEAPCAVALGPDGNMWFLASGANRMWKLEPDGTTTIFDIAPAGAGGSCPGGLAAGPDGNMWFTGQDVIGKMTPTGAVTTYALPSGTFPLSITAGPDGNIWFTTLHTISLITPTGSVTNHPVAALGVSIVTGPDGNLWFTEPTVNRIGRMTVGGSLTEFSAGIPAGSGVSSITPGPDGALWFSEFLADRVGRITTAGVVTDYPMPSGTNPGSITAGGDGNMWIIANSGNDAIWRMGTATAMDSNGDGVDDRIETGPGAFDDGAGTAGSITDAAGNAVYVGPDPDGVRITVGGSGTSPSAFLVCGFSLQLSPGSEVVVTCGSITTRVVSGSAQLVLGDGLTVVSVPAGVTVRLASQPDGSFSLEYLEGGQPVSVTVGGVPGTLKPGETLALNTWQFIGFEAPIDNGGVLNGVKAGKAVPIKWRLLDATGAPVTDLASVTVKTSSLSCAAGTSVDLLEETAAGNSGLQNLGDGYYQYNWKSPKSYAGSCKTMRLDVGDGVLHEALFRFSR